MGVTDGDADEVLGPGDADGETLGLVLGVGVALADEVLGLGDADGEAGADVVPCAGPPGWGPAPANGR